LGLIRLRLAYSWELQIAFSFIQPLSPHFGEDSIDRFPKSDGVRGSVLPAVDCCETPEKSCRCHCGRSKSRCKNDRRRPAADRRFPPFHTPFRPPFSGNSLARRLFEPAQLGFAPCGDRRRSTQTQDRTCQCDNHFKTNPTRRAAIGPTRRPSTMEVQAGVSVVVPIATASHCGGAADPGNPHVTFIRTTIADRTPERSSDTLAPDICRIRGECVRAGFRNRARPSAICRGAPKGVFNVTDSCISLICPEGAKRIFQLRINSTSREAGDKHHQPPTPMIRWRVR